MSTYLITGSAGFIASRICALLLHAGHTVLGVDTLTPAYDVRIKHHRLARLQTIPGFNFAHLDIADPKTIQSLKDLLPTPPAAVINLAAVAGVRSSVENPWLYLETNTTGTLNMLEYCRQAACPKFILASTSSLYGDSGTHPHKETDDTNHPLQPYAASKKGAEVMAHAYHHLYNLDVTIFRYFTVYGPAGRPDMSIFRFCQWIHEERPLRLYGDGSQSRDFTYVDDVARGTILGLKPVGYEVINLGGDSPHDLLELIALVEAEAGAKARIEQHPMHAADVMATWADVGKAQRLLGWEPRVSLKEGVARLCEWYRENRDWAKDVHTED